MPTVSQQPGNNWPTSFTVGEDDKVIVFKAEKNWVVEVAENLGWQISSNDSGGVTCFNVSPGTYSVKFTNHPHPNSGAFEGSGSTSLEITTHQPEPPL
jgi:hypothetical protein